MNLRILQIMNRVPWPLKDGGALGYYQFTKAYAEAGCEVTVAALNTEKHFVAENNFPFELKSIAKWHTAYCDNRVKPLQAAAALMQNKSYNISRFDVPEMHTLLQHLLQTSTFDVIIFESLFTAPYLSTVRQYTNAPCVLRQHNVEYRIWSTLADVTTHAAKRWYLHQLSKQLEHYEISMLNEFDAITTVTTYDAADFKRMGCAKPIFHAPFGLFANQIQQTKYQGNSTTIFHLGSMEWQPNVHAMQWFLQEVWPTVHQQNPEITFALGGRGMPESFLQADIPGVKVYADVPDANTFMSDKQIMVVPLFSGSGIRVKILEGMALGKCVVTTTLGIQGIEAEHKKHVLVANDANQFIEAIQLLMNNTFAQQIGEQAKQLVNEQYHINKIVDSLLQFYKGLRNN
ncbi:MAG: glycosyltransferase family 4 protein [Bacteroidia bacterium]|jgi:glycosyltransferase involved in cell wall biosynthesis|nr:glycosyltransferase family 4 protein [Bacteroidia bacterium]